MPEALFEHLDFDNLTEDEEEWLRSWNREDLIPGEGEEEELVYDLSDLRKPELQRQAELRDLDTSGTMDDLQDRIEEYDAE